MRQSERLETGITGLDTILCGGLLCGASYIVQGSPGTGKTILANQVAFLQARRGTRVLYVTLLAESHDRLFQSLSTFDFYDTSIVDKEIIYISLSKVLREGGLPGLVRTLRAELVRQRCTMLIVDGFSIAKDSAAAALDIKTFIAELQGYAALIGGTVLLLTSSHIDDASREHTMVDGVLQLKEELVGVRGVRLIRVAKSRGSASLAGLHQYRISAKGIDVYPRLEALATPSSDETSVVEERATSGVHGFDGISGGGLVTESVTLLMGPPGSGKTTFGLNFVSAATRNCPALFFGFYESPARLRVKARALHLPIEPLEHCGALHVCWNPLRENLLDFLGHQLLDTIRKHGIRRVFIDGMTGFQRAAVHSAREIEFYTALTNELRALGTTTVAALEMRDSSGGDVAPLPEYSSLMDNLVRLRQTVIDGELSRLLNIVKMRDSAFDNGLHEVQIREGGLHLSGRLAIMPDFLHSRQLALDSRQEIQIGRQPWQP